MNPPRRGFLLALLVMVVDQATKAILVPRLEHRDFYEITPFFNLTMVWNRGVSFGLLNGHSELMPWLLVAFTGAITAVLCWWLRKAVTARLSLALGMIIGGATGNIIDRLHWGAVADFIDVHIGTLHWPAFNVADSAICIGVVVLLYDNFASKHDQEPTSTTAP